jgi:hypothetical protein
MGLDRAFEAAGPEVLSFVTDPPTDFFKAVAIKAPLIKLLFAYPVVYSSLDFSRALQERFSRDFAFPAPFLDSADLALVNCSLGLECHFANVYWATFRDCIGRHDYDRILVIFRPVIDFLPYVIVADQAAVYDDLDNVLPLFRLELSNPLLVDIMRRMLNDQRLLRAVCFMTNLEFSPNDLSKSSLPFLLQYSLGNPEVLGCASLQFFVISDADSRRDYDFLRCYRLLRTFFRCCRTPSKELKTSIDTIKELIDTIANQDLRDDIILDLFSCLFIRKDDKFICHAYVAKKIVMLLDTYCLSPYIRGAVVMFKKQKSKKRASLDMFFNNNHGEIYKAIEREKWEQADQMTAFLPYYRALYRKSRAAKFVTTSMPVPEEFSDDVLLVDVALSTFERAIFQTVPSSKFDALIAKRSALELAESVMDWTDSAKWIESIKSAHFLDNSLSEAISEGNIIAELGECHQLKSFLTTVMSYYQAVSKYGSRPSFEEILRFDVTDAIAGTFNAGEFALADQLSNHYHLDLFQLVLANHETFQIAPQFVGQNFAYYPLEYAMLAWSHRITTLPDSISRPFVRFVTRAAPESESPQRESNVEKITRLIKSGKTEIVDDYIYDCDLEDLYRRLIKTDFSQPTDALVRALDVCGFVSAAVADKRAEQRIRVFHQVRKVTKSQQPSLIVADLVQFDLFDLSVSYIKTCIPEESWGPSICQLFASYLTQSKKIQFLLREFPTKYDLLSARFFHVPEVVPLLIQNCPPERKEQMSALAELPEEITLEANIIDISSVISTFSRKPEFILQLTPRTAALFTDANFIKFLDATEGAEASYKYYLTLYPYFRNKLLVKDHLIQRLLKTIPMIEVYSWQGEDHCVRFFTGVRLVIDLFPDSREEFAKVSCIEDFILDQVFLKFRYCYSFSDFGTAEFCPKMVELCSQFDLHDLAIRFSIAFSEDLTSYQIKRLNLMLVQGFYDPVRELFQLPRPPKLDRNSESIDDFSLMLTPLSRMPMFNVDRVSALPNLVPVHGRAQIEPFMVYQQIKTIIRNQFALDQPRQELLKAVINSGLSVQGSIAMNISLRFFEPAYKRLMGIRRLPDRVKIFINSCYSTALARGGLLMSMEKFFFKQDPTLSVTESLWDGLVSYLQDRKLFENALRLLTVLHRFEDASFIAIELFSQETVVTRQISRLSHIRYGFSESIYFRTHPQSGGLPPFRAMAGKMAADIERMIELTDVMHVVIDFCHEAQLPFRPEYNVLKLNVPPIQLAADLLINQGFSQFEALNRVLPVPIRKLHVRMGEAMAVLPLQELLRALVSFKERSIEIAQELATIIIRRIALGPNRQTISTVIVTCWPKPADQCPLFLEFGYLQEAFSSGKKAKLTHLMPMIAHRASMAGEFEIMKACQKGR